MSSHHPERDGRARSRSRHNEDQPRDGESRSRPDEAGWSRFQDARSQPRREEDSSHTRHPADESHHRESQWRRTIAPQPRRTVDSNASRSSVNSRESERTVEERYYGNGSPYIAPVVAPLQVTRRDEQHPAPRALLPTPRTPATRRPAPSAAEASPSSEYSVRRHSSLSSLRSRASKFEPPPKSAARYTSRSGASAAPGRSSLESSYSTGSGAGPFHSNHASSQYASHEYDDEAYMENVQTPQHSSAPQQRRPDVETRARSQSDPSHFGERPSYVHSRSWDNPASRLLAARQHLSSHHGGVTDHADGDLSTRSITPVTRVIGLHGPQTVPPIPLMRGADTRLPVPLAREPLPALVGQPLPAVPAAAASVNYSHASHTSGLWRSTSQLRDAHKQQAHLSTASAYSSALAPGNYDVVESLGTLEGRDKRLTTLVADLFDVQTVFEKASRSAHHSVMTEHFAERRATAQMEAKQKKEGKLKRLTQHLSVSEVMAYLTPEDLIRADSGTLDGGSTSIAAMQRRSYFVGGTSQVNWAPSPDPDGAFEGTARRRSLWPWAQRQDAPGPQSPNPPPRVKRATVYPHAQPALRSVFEEDSPRGGRDTSFDNVRLTPRTPHRRQDSDATLGSTYSAGHKSWRSSEDSMQKGEKNARASLNSMLTVANDRARAVSTLEGRPYDARQSLLPLKSKAEVVAECLAQGSAPPGMPYDPTLVTWDGDNDPENPRNWPSRKKWVVTVLISLSTFASNFGIANMAPALGLISLDYHMTTSVQRGLVIALYVLAFAVAPLVYAPFSEIFGRKAVLVFGLCLYLAFNTACAFAPSYEVLAVFRFFAGFGASAPLAVGGGLLTDIWPPEQRAKAMAVFSLAPQMGPVIGPIMGGWITQLLVAWKDIVYISSGMIAALLIAFIPFVKESYGPFILARRAARRRKEENNPELSTVFERKAETLRIKLVKGMVVPFVLLFREPLLQTLVLYVGVLFAVFYLQKTTIPAVFGTVYHEKPGIASLHYLAIGLGLTVGGVIGGRRTDMEFRRLTVKNMGHAVPEFKLSIMRVFSFFPPVGLLLYSWSADQALPWGVADLGLFIYAIGMSASVISAQAYLVECYGLLAAPALLASVFVRSTMGFSAPLFGEAMYDAMGLGGGGSMMAGLCFAIGVPTPFLLFRFGPMLRARSTYANHKHD